jgi:hypothetical protein
MNKHLMIKLVQMEIFFVRDIYDFTVIFFYNLNIG